MEDFDQIKYMVLRQLNRCVVCHREYEITDITSVQRKPGVWTLMVECEQCRSRNYIAAVTAEGNAEDALLEVRSLTQRAMRAQGQIADDEDDDSIYSEAPATGHPVTAGDVVDLHEFLRDFDGDFARLFRAG